MNNPIGIMQGRLLPDRHGGIQSFPGSNWRQEFFLAQEVGLEHIEWIYEFDDHQNNPISADQGIQEIQNAIEETSVGIISLCADYFMDCPYLKADQKKREQLREHLVWLVQRAAKLKVQYIDLPFVDASAIDPAKDFDTVEEFLKPALDEAKTYGVIIALETNLGPQDFLHLLKQIDHPNVAANYDTGNSSSLGYDVLQELEAYGQWLRTVHIKDRVLHGTTVPLGTGDAHFDLFFEQLQKLNFKGPIVLQAAREEGSEKETALKNLNFVKKYFLYDDQSHGV